MSEDLPEGMDPRITELVIGLMPQARSEAWKVYQSAPHALEVDELTSLAYTGLMMAAARWPAYCASRGYDPEAYQFFAAYCCVPETPVLSADLRWVPVGDLKTGHELVGVEEFPRGKGKHRRLFPAEVLEVERRQAECLRLVLADGREVVCSADHLWLTWGHFWKDHSTGLRATSHYNWYPSRLLRPGSRIASQLVPWQEETSFEAGWLAGIIDGEGCYRGISAGRRGIQITQNRGPVLDRMLVALNSLGIPYRLQDKSSSDVCVRVNIDQLPAVLKLAGSLRLTRFTDRGIWDGRSSVNRKGGLLGNYAEVVAVEPAGLREVVTLETSTGTYIANGLVAHNCLRRIRGAMLDAMRSADWVTRSTRSRAKRLREEGADTGASEAELAKRTGLTVRQIRDTEAGVAARPVAFDAGSHDVADTSGVEETAAVAGILGQVVAAMDGLDPLAQVVLALRFHQGREFGEIAEALGISEAEVTRLHNTGVLAVHEAMLRSVT